MKIRRLLSVFLLAALLCGLFTVPAAALEDPDIRAKAALLVEAETGTILYDKNAHDELSIASTTKIMSALLIFEAIERGELRMDQSVTATASALRGLPEDGSTADIVEGETAASVLLRFLQEYGYEKAFSAVLPLIMQEELTPMQRQSRKPPR